MFMAQAGKADRVEDEGILPRVARREPEAMEDCIDRYGGLVWGITRRYLRGQADAEDVVQEVFAELWTKADRFDPDRASASTFIGLITRRRNIDWLRKQACRPKLEPITEEIESGHPEENANPVRVDLEGIEAVLKELPLQTQELFRLHFTREMTHPEIASETGLALGTVKTGLRRGLIEIRNRLRQREGNQYQVS